MSLNDALFFDIPSPSSEKPFTPAFPNEPIPHNKIWYTSTNNEIIDFEMLRPKKEQDEALEMLEEEHGHFGTNLISNTYKDGKGVLVFDNFVSIIKDNIFAGIQQLESIYLPDSIISIGNGAFEKCLELKHVKLPEELVFIGTNTFKCCPKLTTINLPSTLTKIGAEAFCFCSSLRNITLPSALISIGEGAFFHTDITPSLEIPKGVETIEKEAFQGCFNLQCVHIPEGVTTIGENAFSGCHSLTQINIPKSVREIGTDAFVGCDNLPVVDNILYADSFAVKAMDKTLDTYTLKEDTRFIGDGAFENCASLVSIHLPDGIIKIANSAFENCRKLTDINFPKSLTKIKGFAFLNCRHITSITIPEGVTSIGTCAFGDCSRLKSVHLPESLTEIGDCAFSGCKALANINLPESVNFVGAEAFLGCISLPIENNIKYADTYATSVIDKLVTSCVLREGTRFIASGLFNGCINLNDLTLPDTLTSIEPWDFKGCLNLPEENNIIYAGTCALRVSDNTLENYVLREDTRHIGDFAFGGCKNLTDITLPESVIRIGRDAFIGCENLQHINIPDSVIHIGERAFEGCKDLMSLSVPDGVKKLPMDVFSGCLFNKISLPSDIEIDKYAFFGCDALWLVTIRNPDGTQNEMFGWDFVRHYQLQGVDTSANEKHWFDLEFERWDSQECTY